MFGCWVWSEVVAEDWNEKSGECGFAASIAVPTAVAVTATAIAFTTKTESTFIDQIRVEQTRITRICKKRSKFTQYTRFREYDYTHTLVCAESDVRYDGR